MRIVETAADLAAAITTAKAEGKRVGFVPTMGALHHGHLELVKQAKRMTDFVVVSIFVNPLQFGPGEDFDRYPRTVDADLKKLESANADLVLLPEAEAVYPGWPDRAAVATNTEMLSAGPVGSVFDGASRQGHFDGMLTVVARLFELVNPDVAVFGAKDAQQVFLVRQMAAKRFPGLVIESVETVRESDGLAMSSRNRYLSTAERSASLALKQTLSEASALAQGGGSPSAVLSKATQRMQSEHMAKLDYLALVDPKTFESVHEDFKGQALMLIAAQVGKTRLIDNQIIDF